MQTLRSIVSLLALVLVATIATEVRASSSANSPPFLEDMRIEPAQITDATAPVNLFFKISKATQQNTTIRITAFLEGAAGAQSLTVLAIEAGKNSQSLISPTTQLNIDATGTTGAFASIRFPAAGTYQLTVVVAHNGFTPTTTNTVKVAVGPATVLNPTNAAGVFTSDTDGAVSFSRFKNGIVNVRSFVAGGTASSATVDFEDVPGRANSAVGLNTTHTYINTGLFVITSTVSGTTDATFGGTGGKVRTTIGIGSREINESTALTPPADVSIIVKKAQGKFLFTDDAKPDSVSVSGSIQLPAGFDPARADGNAISVGVGNVTDTVTIDAKGKATGASVKGRISKIQVKYPKLTGAVTAGGELAAITVTYSLANLDTAGFDTDGISNLLRGVEFNQKSVFREVQFNLLVGGVDYKTLVPVGLKLSKPNKTTFDRDSGSFKFIPTRSAK